MNSHLRLIATGVYGALMILPEPAAASDAIAPTSIEQRVCADVADVLVLNGKGKRTRLFFDVYLAALYLPEQNSSAEEIIESKAPKRLKIHVLLDEIDKETLIENWRSGLEANHTADQISALNDRLEYAFDTFFSDTSRGDEIVIDYSPCIGTVVSVNGERRGVVPGQDFHQAVLRIWLGQTPAQASLKKALLGINQR